MTKILEGQIALVTGASRGIGRAIAKRLAADGAFVGVHYGRSEKEARSAVEEIRADGGRAFLLQADLAQGEVAAAQLFRQFDKETAGAKLNILVNNAGVANFAAFDATDEATFDALFDVNVKGLFFVTQRALPRLADGGRIVNLSSVVARTHFPGIPAYSATKGAVNTLTTHLAVELGPRNITVNAIAPGATETEMSAWLQTEQGQQTALSIQALQRVGQPEDIARAVAFLAGPDGAWVTGQVIETTGGTKL